MQIFIDILKSFGPVVALVSFLCWKDYIVYKDFRKSSEDLTKRIREIEDYQRARLEELIAKTIEAMNNNTNTIKEIIRTLKSKPCGKELGNV